MCYGDWPESPPPIRGAHRWTSGCLRPLMKTWPPAGSEPSVAAGVRHQLLPQRPQLPAVSAPARGHCLWLSGWCALPRWCPGSGRSCLFCRRWSTAAWGRPAPLEGRTLWWYETKITGGRTVTYSFPWVDVPNNSDFSGRLLKSPTKKPGMHQNQLP